MSRPLGRRAPTDNRRAGARMGAQLSDYCNGQAFIIEP